ncbi:alpha/beta hydrolase [Hafnia psychrotolerans]|uniref:Alpha/beta hydrolase n=1 Tax=Hafnia psychrotolerans TaxID=1477018 RepID=A0ABQ1FZ53_9GAMM|nr:alpha/beta fold hydrolase [Hafnia psychrotolerans]GGA34299.1 alpha/beta hydrolase [Hafnia psychrotolerans]
MSYSTQLSREAFAVDSDTAGIQLWLRHRWLADRTVFDTAHTVILMHGATYSSGSLFDTQVEGESFIDYLAASGMDVWAVDVRGYGGASRMASFEAPALDNPPSARAEVAACDLGSAIDFILKRQNLTQLNIIGMSWGGTVSALYTTLNAGKVRRLTLIAPQWLQEGKPALDPGGAIGAWRDIDIDAIEARWLRGVPDEKKQDLIPPEGFSQWAMQTLSDEPNLQLKAQRKIRASTGPIQDTRVYWSAGIPVYDPADIRVPVLLLHGEWDQDVPINATLNWYLRATGAPWKRWVEIGEATHMMVLEKNRKQVFALARDFITQTLNV